jgi:two-component system LytT family response regulator
MNCYLIDDEKHAIDLLSDYIGRLDSCNVVGWTVNPGTALTDIENLNNVDLVFTDINMPEISGFDIIEKLPKHILVIVTTVNSYYREPANELGVFAVLLKPFEFSTFQKAVKNLGSRK